MRFRASACHLLLRDSALFAKGARLRPAVIGGSSMPLRVYDDRARELLFLRPPRRVASLVPSETVNVFALGVGDRLVGRTRYCVAPEGQVENVPEVGGTKDVDVQAVAALHPDLVLCNQEENSRPHVEQLARLQLPVFVS